MKMIERNAGKGLFMRSSALRIGQIPAVSAISQEKEAYLNVPECSNVIEITKTFKSDLIGHNQADFFTACPASSSAVTAVRSGSREVRLPCLPHRRRGEPAHIMSCRSCPAIPCHSGKRRRTPACPSPCGIDSAGLPVRAAEFRRTASLFQSAVLPRRLFIWIADRIRQGHALSGISGTRGDPSPCSSIRRRAGRPRACGFPLSLS